MGWTDPRTWVPQTKVTAAQLNVDVRDNLNYLRAGLIVATKAALVGLVGMVEGEIAYVTSTDLIYKFTGTAWVPAGVQTLAVTTLASAATSIDLSSLNQDFEDIEGSLYGRTDRASTADDIVCEANGDTTAANYNDQFLQGSGASTAAGGSSSGRIHSLPAASSTAGRFGGGPMSFTDYTHTGERRVAIGKTGSPGSTGIIIWAWEWTNTADAIDRLTLKPNAGTNFLADTKVLLKGVPANV